MKSYPYYFSAYNLPVKVSRRRDGRVLVLAWDPRTDEFVPRPDLLDAYVRAAAEVESLTEAEFKALLARRRAGQPW
jgi:hypothetical protein